MELKRLQRNTPKNVKAYDTVLKKVHRAEVDFNYCQYYPVDRTYQPLSDWRDFGSEITNVMPSLNGTAAQLWKLVEHCMETGELNSLKEGSLGKRQERQGASAQREPKLEQSIGLARVLACDGSADVNDEGPDVAMQKASKSPARNIDNIPEDDEVMVISSSSNYDVSSEIGDDKVTSNGINTVLQVPVEIAGKVQDVQQSAGEASVNAESDNSDDYRSSDEEDAMIEYANSERKAQSNGQQKPAPRIESKHRARILADLSPEDLNAQLRYFHASEDSKEVYHDIPVRCLVCGKAGHLADECEQLDCVTCGAYNKHITANCPASAKCAKCREQGHKESSCPYKLKRMSRHEIVCDLCERNGHFEDECELFWRTSGRPWESSLSRQDIRIFCYECGRSGHLGNDCTARQPGKAMGTSTWSLRKAGPTPSSSGEISIRGRARQAPPFTSHANEDDDHGNFYRLKPLEQARKGQIRINVANSKTVETFQPTWTSVNQRSQNDGSYRPQYDYPPQDRREIYQDYRNDYHGGGSNSYRKNDFHSQYYNEHTSYRASHHQPHPPRQPGSHYVNQPRPQDTSRPMPSTVHSAWPRH